MDSFKPCISSLVPRLSPKEMRGRKGLKFNTFLPLFVCVCVGESLGMRLMHPHNTTKPKLAREVTCLLFEISRSSSSHGKVVHVLLDVDEVLCPLSQLMQHSLVLATMQ